MQTEVKVLDGRVDFDFFMGQWTLTSRRLRARLAGSTEWEAFDGIAHAGKILGGLGNFDEVTFNRERGAMLGATLRLFDVPTQLWRIYWASEAQGILDVPMIGAFKNGRGEFYAQEMFEGQAIFSRFVWTHDSDDSCRWEQAFSPDAGKSWEINWVVDFTRVN